MNSTMEAKEIIKEIVGKHEVNTLFSSAVAHQKQICIQQNTF